jgi:ATP-binding cassette subfamily B protein
VLLLSTGQRQLLAIARAMSYDPKVLILDEATANIDSETEHLIQQAILVLHNGRIVEHGTQEDLLSRRDFYYRLHQLQFASP